MDSQPLIFSGSSHKKLAEETCKALGISLSPMDLSSFPDKEISVTLQEDVQGRNVFIFQSLAIDPNYYLMELLIIIDALKRSLAKRITAVIPYLSYCRQDRRNKAGVPITAKLVANLLSSAGIHHLITFDLHSNQIEGFFEIPITHLHCQKILSDEIKPLIGENTMVVSPDIGGIKIAESMAKYLGVDIAIIKKKRRSSFDVDMTLIGDVEGKNVLISDDLCSTAITLTAAAKLCHKCGAKSIISTLTHGLFTQSAIKLIEESVLTFVLTTNTIAMDPEILSKKIRQVSVAKELAECIRNLSL